ncbi:MAG: hypothetical protein ACTSRV_13730, partial [Candidatus Freyarchaeota archaeon]
MNERLRELREKWTLLEKLNQKPTDEEKRKEERRARTVSIERVKQEELGGETVNEAKKVPSSIILGVKKALRTLKISSEENLKDFYVSKKEAVTARW